MKKYLVCALLALALLSGCITNPPTLTPNHTTQYVPSSNVSPEPEANLSNLVNTSENETASTVYIKAFNKGGEWFFPLQNYSGEFADAGIYSSVFIKLNNSQLKTLGNDESLWITPYTSDGKGILFNAILSKEVNNCNLSAVRLLGKYYTMDYLKTSPNFNNDDKWKITTVGENRCIKRILIVQSGYFYDISEDESISLFTNDGSLSAQFRNLSSAPELAITVLKSTSVPSSEANATINTTNATAEVPGPNPKLTIPYTREFDINLSWLGYNWTKQYHGTETVNGGGVYLDFDPALPAIVNLSITDYYDQAHRSWTYSVTQNGVDSNDSHEHAKSFALFAPSIPIPGSETENYVITCLDYPDSSTSKICLGKEISRSALRLGENITMDNTTYRLDEVGNTNFLYPLFENSSNWLENCSTESTSVSLGRRAFAEGAILERLYNSTDVLNTSNIAFLCLGHNYPVSDSEKIFITDATYWSISAEHVDFILNNEFEFENGKDGVVLDWSTANGVPALKSVFIPSTHPYYAQLLS